MNSVLAVENSSRRSSVAVWKDGTCIFDEHFFSERRQTGPLFSLTKRALDAGGTVDMIAVGTGPGSYNGLRAALALCEGIALARGIPCAGWSSLLGFPPEGRLLAGDARSGQLFFAAVENQQFLINPELLPFEELERRAATVPGHSDFLRCWVGENPPSSNWTPAFPSARELASLAWQEASISAGLPTRALPIYLKPPHITRPAT